MTSLRVAIVGLVVVLAACEEEPQSTVTPIELGDRRRAPVVDEPSPYVVSPHVRRREVSDEERRAEARAGMRGGGGAGGGGGGFGSRAEDWVPRTSPEPSAREVEAFRRRLDQQMEGAVDPEDDPCAQFADVGGAAAEAAGGGSMDPEEQRELRRRCAQFPEGYRQCLDREYFREHLDECQGEFAAMARRGERLTEQAREQRRQLDDPQP